jgi:signal recognition particle receptor subunit beta
VELKHRDRVVQIKIVYYGPAIGGKTTNLQMLHSAAAERHRGEFISVTSAQDRTILFDLLPLKGVGFHGFEIRFQVVAVPGQAPYSATRRLVLRGADAVVFVANSAADRVEENVASLREMTDHLLANQIDPGTVPIVFQYNKRDLPDVTPIDELEDSLNYRDAPSHAAVAIWGEGVLETLGSVLVEAMGYLMGRYRSLALPPGETVEAWTWEMLHRVFGKASIARNEAPPAPSPDESSRRVVRVSVPRVKVVSGGVREAEPDSSGAVAAETAPEPAGEDRARTAPVARAREEERPEKNERVAAGVAVAPQPSPSSGVAESYVQASLELSEALERMRDERDTVRRRLAELEHTLRAIEAVELGRPAGEALRDALEGLVSGGICRAGTLLGAGSDRSVRLIATVGIQEDPFLRLKGGERVVRQRFFPLKTPILVNPEKSVEVATAVAPLHPPVKAVVAVPVRSALGLHGLALLYYGKTDPLPPPATLAHLGHMARVLAAWFSVRRAASMRMSAEGIRRTLPQIESAARGAEELVREAARNPKIAAPALEKVARTLDGLAKLTADLIKPGAPPAKPPGGR